MGEETKNPDTAGQARRPLAARVLYALRLVAVNFLIFAVLAELACIVIVHWKRWPSTRPSYRLNYNTFWADLNPMFGPWHRPNDHYLHQEGCFSVEYTTNSYGARDKERSLHSPEPRTVVVGDSFVEGYGLPDDERLSNLLERDTGREYLNFGTSGGFGPLQYALLYKTLASKFDHNVVMVEMLPENDFTDMSLAYWKTHGRMGGRHRPYYADDYSIIYTGPFDPNAGQSIGDRAEAILRAYLASYHVGKYIYGRFIFWQTEGDYSGYNDYDDVDLTRLKVSLEDIKRTADAHGARVAVFVIPTANDFRRLHQAGTDRLGPVLEQWGNENGIAVKDMLPEMDARANGNYMPYFQSCDGHWSAYGSRVAADILEPWLGETKTATK